MRTVGRQWPASAPRGDHQATCDSCGVQWRRSQLVRKADGLLYCPDDVDGLDVVTLAEGNAAATNSRQYGNLTRDGAGFDKDTPIPIANPTTTKPSGSFT